MKLNRRNVLAGLGTAAVGTGAAFGSGAFTSVEADRDVEIRVATGDDGALQLNANSESSEYVEVEDDQLTIDLPDLGEDTTVDIDEPFAIVNNVGTGAELGDDHAIDVWVSIDDSEWASALTLEPLDGAETPEDDDIVHYDEEDDPADNFVRLEDPDSGTSETNVNITVDTSGLEAEDQLEEATFHAELHET